MGSVTLTAKTKKFLLKYELTFAMLAIHGFQMTLAGMTKLSIWINLFYIAKLSL